MSKKRMISDFNLKFNPTIQPTNQKFNYLRMKIQKIPTQKLKFWVGWLDFKVISVMIQTEINRKGLKDLAIRYIRNTNNEE